MNIEKPSLYVPPAPPKALCPICGTPSYSLGGIHPQCAIKQADEPRVAKLRAARTIAPKATKPVQPNWKKVCPKCGSSTHITRKTCACGFDFTTRR